MRHLTEEENEIYRNILEKKSYTPIPNKIKLYKHIIENCSNDLMCDQCGFLKYGDDCKNHMLKRIVELIDEK